MKRDQEDRSGAGKIKKNLWKIYACLQAEGGHGLLSVGENSAGLCKEAWDSTRDASLLGHKQVHRITDG